MLVRRTKAIAAAIIFASALMLVGGPAAQAATTLVLTPMISIHGLQSYPPNVECGGSNSTTGPSADQNLVGVSWVCQYSKIGSTTWTNSSSSIPSKSCNFCSGSGYGSFIDQNPCGRIGSGNWLFRSRVDGWWYDSSGIRHDMNAVSSSTVEVDCGPLRITPSGKLAALVLVTGSTGGSGPNVQCKGSNSMTPLSVTNSILVSWVCQKNRPGTTTWSNVGSAPSSGALSYRFGTGVWGASINCSSLGSGAWNVRAHIDGYWVKNGVRTDQNAINSNTLNVFC